MKNRTNSQFKITCSVLALILLLAVPVPAQDSNPIITVLDFKTSGVSESDMQLIVSMLSTELFDTGKYTVIDACQRDAILSEMAFSLSGCADESCRLEVGKLLSADMIVVGNIGKAGSRLILDTKILRTETGETVCTADGKYAEPMNLSTICRSLPGDLPEKLISALLQLNRR